MRHSRRRELWVGDGVRVRAQRHRDEGRRAEQGGRAVRQRGGAAPAVLVGRDVADEHRGDDGCGVGAARRVVRRARRAGAVLEAISAQDRQVRAGQGARAVHVERDREEVARAHVRDPAVDPRSRSRVRVSVGPVVRARDRRRPRDGRRRRLGRPPIGVRVLGDLVVAVVPRLHVARRRRARSRRRRQERHRARGGHVRGPRSRHQRGDGARHARRLRDAAHRARDGRPLVDDSRVVGCRRHLRDVFRAAVAESQARRKTWPRRDAQGDSEIGDRSRRRRRHRLRARDAHQEVAPLL
mmetsp:Transcript_16106/g.65060  ORF Transcript_16106/g.65060 Transcript_16106/m.65060 type:complete len:297 (-) Transcript_16106:409-1299(-)